MQCMVLPKAVFVLRNVHQGAPLGARRQHTRSHACFTVKSAVQSACVCLLARMGTNSLALATTTGRLREEGPNALENHVSTGPSPSSSYLVYLSVISIYVTSQQVISLFIICPINMHFLLHVIRIKCSLVGNFMRLISLYFCHFFLRIVFYWVFFF